MPVVGLQGDIVRVVQRQGVSRLDGVHHRGQVGHAVAHADCQYASPRLWVGNDLVKQQLFSGGFSRGDGDGHSL